MTNITGGKVYVTKQVMVLNGDAEEPGLILVDEHGKTVGIAEVRELIETLTNTYGRTMIADDSQETLRAHFLALRKRCEPGMTAHDEQFPEPMGDEII